MRSGDMSSSRESLKRKAKDSTRKRELTIKPVKRFRVVVPDNDEGKLIASQSQEELMSSFEDTQSPRLNTHSIGGIKRTNSGAPAAFFNQSSSDSSSDTDTDKIENDVDEKAEHVEGQPAKRLKVERPFTPEPGPAFAMVKTNFMASLAEFYAVPAVQNFDQKKIAAALLGWFAECLEKPALLSFAKATQTADKKKSDKERKSYNKFLNKLTMESYAAASSLSTSGGKDHIFNTYVHKHLVIYTFKIGKDAPQPYAGYRAKMIAKLAANRSLNFRTAQYTKELEEFDKFLLANIKSQLPKNSATQQQFVESVITTKLNQIEVYFHARRAKFLVCLMHELGVKIAKRSDIAGLEMKALGNIFKARAEVLTKEFVLASAGDKSFLPEFNNTATTTTASVSTSSSSFFGNSSHSSSSSSTAGTDLSSNSSLRR
jgi:hypothetical protein